MSRQRWTEVHQRAALNRGSYQSTISHIPFWGEEFDLMVGKG